MKQSVVKITPHPGNGQGSGGCVISSKFVHLECGHRFTVPNSRKIGVMMWCAECAKKPSPGPRLIKGMKQLRDKLKGAKNDGKA